MYYHPPIYFLPDHYVAHGLQVHFTQPVSQTLHFNTTSWPIGPAGGALDNAICTLPGSTLRTFCLIGSLRLPLCTLSLEQVLLWLSSCCVRPCVFTHPLCSTLADLDRRLLVLAIFLLHDRCPIFATELSAHILMLHAGQLTRYNGRNRPAMQHVLGTSRLRVRPFCHDTAVP